MGNETIQIKHLSLTPRVLERNKLKYLLQIHVCCINSRSQNLFIKILSSEMTEYETV